MTTSNSHCDASYSRAMKKCAYCGKEYADDAVRCLIDGEPLAGGEPQPPPTDSVWHPQLIDLGQMEEAFDYEEGFSRPNWTLIAKAIEQTISPEDLPDAWVEAALEWAQQVRRDLGGEYHVRWSKEFILVSALEAAPADQFLAFAEGTLEHINATLKDAAWRSGHGKHVILLFADEDDYYQYVSYFHQGGIHPTSGGCLIHKDYVHIAMPYHDGRSIRRVLVHELVHNSVVHLRLPLWLNEGLAVVLDRAAAGWRQTILDHDLRDRHLAYWNAENIQKFWSGVSFGEPGDSNELSYSLAEIVVNLLVGQSKEFGAFLKQANWEDAGQTAALDVLGADLGQTAGTFLGDGNWRPNRKAMVACWNAAQAADEKGSRSAEDQKTRGQFYEPILIID